MRYSYQKYRKHCWKPLNFRKILSVFFSVVMHLFYAAKIFPYKKKRIAKIMILIDR